MCSTSNSPSFKERVQCYISKKEEIEAEYKSKIKALNEEACADILAIVTGKQIGRAHV